MAVMYSAEQRNPRACGPYTEIVQSAHHHSSGERREESQQQLSRGRIEDRVWVPLEVAVGVTADSHKEPGNSGAFGGRRCSKMFPGGEKRNYKIQTRIEQQCVNDRQNARMRASGSGVGTSIVLMVCQEGIFFTSIIHCVND